MATKSFNNARLLASALDPKDFPVHRRVEVALAGRSNVGKSSLVNSISSLNRLAFVSKQPGRTQTLNFYALDDGLCLVDLPGYGYAKVSKRIKEAWGPKIEAYLRNREQLAVVVLLIDSRHGPTQDDLSLWHWLEEMGREALPVATKWDKVKKGERHRRLKEMTEALGEEPLTCSATTGEGRDRLLAFLRSLTA